MQVNKPKACNIVKLKMTYHTNRKYHQIKIYCDKILFQEAISKVQ